MIRWRLLKGPWNREYKPLAKAASTLQLKANRGRRKGVAPTGEQQSIKVMHRWFGGLALDLVIMTNMEESSLGEKKKRVCGSDSDGGTVSSLLSKSLVVMSVIGRRIIGSIRI